ncbi:MAG: pitrilysin family protein [Bacteroides sp.]|nr:pitrilysin family protein [Bacteroides sp.]
MFYNRYTLPNGLRIIHQSNASKVTYCGFAVNAGTRDEAENESGLAHFVEHLIFKGTQKRKAWHILNRMENVGGDLNAYTNKEETMIYSAFLNAHFERAVELLVDIVFNSTFPQHEIDKEVDVVLDEIQSYEDNPSDLIFDDIERMIFDTHPLGRYILGNASVLSGIQSLDAKQYVSRYYQPENMVFFVLGDIDFEEVIAVLRPYFDAIPNAPVLLDRQKPRCYTPRRMAKKKDTNQAHVMIAAPSYPMLSPKRVALSLLNNVLGGPGMNSRLNIELRERRGYVYNVESNIMTFTDAGIFSIYFGTDFKNRDHCVDLTLKELAKLRNNKMSTLQLTRAKNQLMGQLGVAEDNNESRALGMGRAFLHLDDYKPLTHIYKDIDALTPEFLQDVANEVFCESQLSFLLYE